MDELILEQTHTEIKELTIEFLIKVQSSDIRNDTKSIEESIGDNDIESKGVSGFGQLQPEIAAANSLETSSFSGGDEYNKLPKKELAKKIQDKLEDDITSKAGVTVNVIEKVCNDIKEYASICIDALKQIDSLEKDLDTLSQDEQKKKIEEINCVLKPINIIINVNNSVERSDEDNSNEEDAAEEGLDCDFSSRLIEIRNSLDDTTKLLKSDLNVLQPVVGKYDEKTSKTSINTQIKNYSAKLKNEINPDITYYRNTIEGHSNNNKNQLQYDYRNRIKSLKEYMDLWTPIFIFRKKADIFDVYKTKALELLSRFDKNYTLHISIGGKECTNVKELIDTISEKWDKGIELLKANNSIRKLIEKEDELLIPSYNTLQSIVQAVVDQEHLSQIDEITHAKERRQNNIEFNSSVYNDYKQWYDACMFKFIYGIDKKYDPLCWKGTKYQPQEYVKKVLFPIINCNGRNSAIREIKRSNLDVLCEYHLISYYCQQKNDDGSDTPHNYDVDTISEIESNILLIDRRTEDSGISLYRLYINIMRLCDCMESHYALKYFGYNNNNSRIEKIDDASKPISDFIENNQITDALNTIKKNLFVQNGFLNNRFLAWIAVNSGNDLRIVKRFTEWYYKFKNCRDSYSNYIGTIGDVLDYSKFIDKIHDDQMPTNELQYDCLLLYKYMELMNYDNLDNIVEHIKDYYYENCKCPHNSIAIKNEQFSKLIPLNEFRTLTEKESIYKNPDEFNAEEKIMLRCLIQRHCSASSSSSSVSDDFSTISKEYEKYRNVYQNLCDDLTPADNQYAAKAFVSAHHDELQSQTGFNNMIVSSLTNKEHPLYESKKKISLTAGINPSSYNALKTVYNKYRLLASEGEKILVWDNSPIIASSVNSINEHLMECKADLSSRKTSLISATIVFILVLSVLIKFFFM